MMRYLISLIIFVFILGFPNIGRALPTGNEIFKVDCKNEPYCLYFVIGFRNAVVIYEAGASPKQVALFQPPDMDPRILDPVFQFGGV